MRTVDLVPKDVYGWVAGKPERRRDFMRRTFNICVSCRHPDFKHAESGKCQDFIEEINRPEGATQARLEVTDKRCGCKKYSPSIQRYQYAPSGTMTGAPQRGYYEPPEFFPKLLVPEESDF